MSVHGPLGATQGGAFELGTPALDSSARSSRARLAMLGLSGLIGAGLLISISAAHTDPLLPESVRPVPSWLAGPFGSAGPNIGAVGLTAVLAFVFASYVVAVWGADQLSARTVLSAIAALYALVLLAPPLLSTDVFSYQAYARMGDLYGANPYVNGPHAIALDALYPYVGAKWVSTPTVYGPLFTALSYVFAHLSVAASTLAYKTIAALASLATVTLVWNAARLRGVNPVKATALVGLNPLIVIYGVGGGHNDLLMLVAVVAGISLVLQHRERAGGASIVVAAGIKLTAGLYLPFALAGARRTLSPSRRRDILIGAGVAAASVAALGFALFGTGPLHLISTVEQVQSEGDWHSIPGLIGTWLGLGIVGKVMGLVLAAAFAGTSCWLLRRVWLGQLDWIAAAGWSTALLLVTASSLLPWYTAWLIPLAALGRDRRLWKTSIVMTGVILGIQLIGYIPHASSTLGL
jgi:alpha-1,6-mannosyltransferase